MLYPLALLHILYHALSVVECQRELFPINEYDMPMYDASLLCSKVEQDKQNGTEGAGNAADFMPTDYCYFFQWIYCPDAPEDRERPCGWWEQKECNRTKYLKEPHFSLEPANPDSKVVIPDDPVPAAPAPASAGQKPGNPSDGSSWNKTDDVAVESMPGPMPTVVVEPMPGPMPTVVVEPMPGPMPTVVVEPMPGPKPTVDVEPMPGPKPTVDVVPSPGP